MLKRIASGILSVAISMSMLITAAGSAFAAERISIPAPKSADIGSIAANSGDTYAFVKGSKWYYKRDTAGASWLNTGFLTDPEWTANATAPIGYGYTTPALGTTLEKGSGSLHIYFQQVFNLSSLSNINSIVLNIDADDSATIYLNGKQIYEKVTDSDVNKDVTAVYPENRQGGSSGTIYLPTTNLKTGQNLISVDLKNATQTSSDIYFDMAFGVSTKQPTVVASAFYKNLVLTPGADETKLNFAWYTPVTSRVTQYYIDASFDDSRYLVSSTGTKKSTYYFNDGTAVTIYKLPLNKTNSVKGLLILDVAANYTIDLSADGTNYTRAAAAPGGEGVAEMGTENRGYVTFKVDDYAPNSDYIWVKIGDQTTGNGWGGQIYSLKVSYTDIDNDGVGDINNKGIEDCRVQIVEESQLVNGKMPEPDENNTFTGWTNDAVSGYASNKVTAPVQPNKKYAYRIGRISTNEWSDIYYTETRSGGSEYNFIFVGDAQLGAGSLASDRTRWIDTVNKASQRVADASFIVSAGDQVNSSDNENEFTALTDAAQLQSIPFVPTIGNHDTLSPNHTYHFNMPNVTENGKTPAGSDYYFFYGDTLYVDINGNNGNAAEHRATIQTAVDAYKNAHNGNQPRWKIAIMHQDIYGSGKQHSLKQSMNALRKGMYPIFDQFDFDVVLTGHDHTYTRSYIMKGNVAQKDSPTGADGQYVNPDGVLYITANSSSGSKYYPLSPVRGTYVNVRNQYNVPSYSTVSITDNEFSISTYRTDTDEVYDSCTIAKNATQEDLNDIIQQGEAVANPSSELTTALTAAKALNNPSSQQLTSAFMNVYNAIPREEIKDEARLESFKIGNIEGTIQEVLNYGDYSNGQYIYDHEALNFEDTVPVTGTVRITVPYSTDLKNVTPEIKVSEGATYRLSKTDFSVSYSPAILTVTSQRGDLECEYTIIVTKEAAKNGFVTGQDNIERYYRNDELVQNQEVYHNGNFYYIKDDGTKVTSAFAPNGCYYGANGVKVRYAFVEFDSKTYFIDVDGKKTTGLFYYENKAYYADASGVVVKNKRVTIGSKEYYFNASGVRVENAMVTIGSKKYYFGTGGVLAKNAVVTWSKKKYYVNGKGEVQGNTWAKIGKKKYYAGKDGVVYTNAVKKIGKKTYAFSSAGVMQSGNKLVKINKKQYFVDKNGYVAFKKIVSVGKKKYYAGSNGVIVKNKLVTIKGKKYYFDKNGVMLKNTKKKIGKKTYKFNSKGIGKVI